MAKRLAVIDGVEVESMHTKIILENRDRRGQYRIAETYSISTRQAERLLTGLKKKEFLVRRGPDKGGHWVVVS